MASFHNTFHICIHPCAQIVWMDTQLSAEPEYTHLAFYGMKFFHWRLSGNRTTLSHMVDHHLSASANYLGIVVAGK